MPGQFIRLFIVLLIASFLTAPAAAQTHYGKFGVGIETSLQYVLGAGSVNSSAGYGGGINMSISALEGLSFRSRFIVNNLIWNLDDKSVKTDFMSISCYVSGDLMPNGNLNIFPFVGIGFVFYDPKDEASGGRPTYISSFDTQISGGVGVEYFPNEFWSISLMPEFVKTGSRYFNGPPDPANDSYFRIALQGRYYFFDQSFITKLLETLRVRNKRK